MNGNSTPNYQHLDYWAAHPAKYDPSDNIPNNAADKEKDSLADVFFIYPTSYTHMKMPLGWNAPIDNKEINQKTDRASMLYQASAFNRFARVYAPRYRQANLNAFFTKDTTSAATALDVAYQDVRIAFEYYLKYENNDRPIIIASHSQGTWHAVRLLKEFFDNKPLSNQLVAAYLIGMPVYENQFQSLKPCLNATATGCIISWRTFEFGFEPPYILAEKEKAIVVNPLTWRTDSEYASASMNKGGLLRNFNKLIPELTDAQIHGNILWAAKPHFFGSALIQTKNFHIADINFYYENIRENVGERIHYFLQKK